MNDGCSLPPLGFGGKYEEWKTLLVTKPEGETNEVGFAAEVRDQSNMVSLIDVALVRDQSGMEVASEEQSGEVRD